VKKYKMKLLAQLLMLICDLIHKLPTKQEEKLQIWFIDIIGYHCPFATWAFVICDKYDLDLWLPNRGRNE